LAGDFVSMTKGEEVFNFGKQKAKPFPQQCLKEEPG